jgi:hypothetical protein
MQQGERRLQWDKVNDHPQVTVPADLRHAQCGSPAAARSFAKKGANPQRARSDAAIVTIL